MQNLDRAGCALEWSTTSFGHDRPRSGDVQDQIMDGDSAFMLANTLFVYHFDSLTKESLLRKNFYSDQAYSTSTIIPSTLRTRPRFHLRLLAVCVACIGSSTRKVCPFQKLFVWMPQSLVIAVRLETLGVGGAIVFYFSFVTFPETQGIWLGQYCI